MKQTLFSIVLFFIALYSSAQELPQTLILKRFEVWKTEQVKNGKYVSDKDCNREFSQKYFDKHPNADIFDLLGIPMDYLRVEFGRINDDDILDAIIFFEPNQCEGGNGIMDIIHKVLVLSEKDSKYMVDDTFFKIIEKQDSLSDDGTHTLMSVDLGYGKNIVAWYGEKNSGTDAHCCYSFRRKIEIDFKTKKIISNKMLYAETEDEAKTVELVFAMQKEGLSIKQIAKIVQKTEQEIKKIIEELKYLFE